MAYGYSKGRDKIIFFKKRMYSQPQMSKVTSAPGRWGPVEPHQESPSPGGVVVSLESEDWVWVSVLTFTDKVITKEEEFLP